MLVFIAGGLYIGVLQAMILYPRSLPGEIVVKGLGGGHAHIPPRSRNFTVTSVTGWRL
jgi:hypothetical protein